MQPLPDPIREYLHQAYGPLTAIELLRGLSQAQIWRLHGGSRSLILKASARSGERAFYERVAPALRAHGIPIPELYWATQCDDSSWMLLEDIPLPFPRTRWLADPQQLAILGRLHSWSCSPALQPADGYRPLWTDQMTQAALSWFPAHTAQTLLYKLQPFREQAQHLFTPQCAISADPNPTNWGLRRDGTLVLYDWERFTQAAPAIDLAITVPGLGDWEAFSAVAERYGSSDDSGRVESLARSIALAKVWVVVEFLSTFSANIDVAPAAITYLTREFPAWLEQVTAGLT